MSFQWTVTDTIVKIARRHTYMYIISYFHFSPLAHSRQNLLLNHNWNLFWFCRNSKKPPIILTNVFPDRFLRSKSSKAIYMWLATTSDLQMKLMFSISPLCSLCLLARYQMKEGPHHRTPAQHLRRWCHEIDDAVLPYALQRAWPPKWRELGQKGLVGAVGASRWRGSNLQFIYTYLYKCCKYKRYIYYFYISICVSCLLFILWVKSSKPLIRWVQDSIYSHKLSITKGWAGNRKQCEENFALVIFL